MSERISPLYAIADAETLVRHNMTAATFVEDLLAAGVRLLQYRDKTSGPQVVLRAAAEISEIFAGTSATLILNDRADLAALAGWGVHVGQGDLSPADARVVVGPDAVIGASTHSEEQVRKADDSTAAYIATGPVFSTSTKLDAEPVIGLDGVRCARVLTRKPLVAIGGITLENCRSVVDAGADSVAVISGLFMTGRSVREVAEEFLSRLRA